jgi:hypothetical protein
MQLVYEAPNALEAHMVVNLLAQPFQGGISSLDELGC